ncbi:DUF2973 domain-containing protein [Phormidium sp. LEGE 05292]|uniref:DUF2973 domain-containing protein n=1 Tax=[Phormidium] sp. LEGE 05292 TaxID=767427 RepID=UPI00187E3B72|nr:DUF2973 domain-containing protein [Phormidium sp. LEGE 05292]MBE9229624.1 DUF2973 domain-containing protein [Phormidium sp. LEGE 05292]
MLHLLYILAFTCLAFLAVGNLIRNLIRISADYQYSTSPASQRYPRRDRPVPHPEFIDDSGNFIDEPLLIMKSIAVEDARQKLESLYESPPENSAP